MAENSPKPVVLSTWPAWLTVAGILLLATLVLRIEDRPWWCSCREPIPFAVNAHGPHNSQHLSDPYSLTHFVKGILYCGILWWALPRVHWSWGLVIAVVAEAAWEVL